MFESKLSERYVHLVSKDRELLAFSFLDSVPLTFWQITPEFQYCTFVQLVGVLLLAQLITSKYFFVFFLQILLISFICSYMYSHCHPSSSAVFSERPAKQQCSVKGTLPQNYFNSQIWSHSLYSWFERFFFFFFLISRNCKFSNFLIPKLSLTELSLIFLSKFFSS